MLEKKTGMMMESQKPKIELRRYQIEGINKIIKKFNCRALLADDMGLGKTVQIIAFLEYQRIEKGGKALLILPTSLIGNWEKEIEKWFDITKYFDADISNLIKK